MRTRSWQCSTAGLRSRPCGDPRTGSAEHAAQPACRHTRIAHTPQLRSIHCALQSCLCDRGPLCCCVALGGRSKLVTVAEICSAQRRREDTRVQQRGNRNSTQPGPVPALSFPSPLRVLLLCVTVRAPSSVPLEPPAACRCPSSSDMLSNPPQQHDARSWPARHQLEPLRGARRPRRRAGW